MPNFGQNLEVSRARALADVDAAIASQRTRFITAGAGQEMVYLAKEAEARRYLSGPAPVTLDGFPFLAAEVGITAADAASVAQVFLNLSDLWRDIGAGLERMKSAAKAEILGAGSVAEINAALVRFHSALN